MSDLSEWWQERKRMNQVARDIDYGGSTYAKMKEYIREHHPDLDAELGPMPILDELDKLNEFTGLNVLPTELVRRGSVRFLGRLKEMDNERSE